MYEDFEGSLFLLQRTFGWGPQTVVKAALAHAKHAAKQPRARSLAGAANPLKPIGGGRSLAGPLGGASSGVSSASEQRRALSWPLGVGVSERATRAVAFDEGKCDTPLWTHATEVLSHRGCFCTKGGKGRAPRDVPPSERDCSDAGGG